MSVTLEDFEPEVVGSIEHWFDDPETQRRLGDRDWIRRAPSLLGSTIGDEFRGKVVTGRLMWLAIDGAGDAVAFVDAEMYDRYAAWDGSDVRHPRVSDVVEVPSMGLAFVVDPRRRRRGFGNATLRAVIEHPAAAHVRLFFASTDSDNAASIGCLRNAGFRQRSPDADFEGMLHFSVER